MLLIIIHHCLLMTDNLHNAIIIDLLMVLTVLIIDYWLLSDNYDCMLWGARSSQQPAASHKVRAGAGNFRWGRVVDYGCLATQQQQHGVWRAAAAAAAWRLIRMMDN